MWEGVALPEQEVPGGEREVGQWFLYEASFTGRRPLQCLSCLSGFQTCIGGTLGMVARLSLLGQLVSGFQRRQVFMGVVLWLGHQPCYKRPGRRGAGELTGQLTQGNHDGMAEIRKAFGAAAGPRALGRE